MRHHFIPRFYLQNWVDAKDNKLVEFSKRYGAVKKLRRTASGAGFQIDLYQIDGENGLSMNIFETGFLSKVDSIAALALRKLIAGEPLHHKERIGWIVFLLSIAARNPASVEALKEIFLSDLSTKRAQIRIEAEKIGENTDYMATDASFEAVLIEEACKAALALIQGFITNIEVIRLINKMHWRILNLGPDDAALLTSDRPLLMTNGLDNFDGQLILPLSPSCAFLAFRSRIQAKRVCNEETNLLRDQVKKWVVNQAVECVYSFDEKSASEIAADLGSKPKLLYVNYRQA